MKALANIVREYDVENTRNIERWGQPLMYGITVLSGRPTNSTRTFSLVFDARTISVLEDLGLVQIHRSQTRHERLRRHRFGRGYSGSVSWNETNLTATPTDKGRAVLAAYVVAESGSGRNVS